MLVLLTTLLAREIVDDQTPTTNFGWSSCLAPGTDIATINCFPLIFQRFVFGAWMLAGITATILIAYSGARIVMAEGDKKKLEEARHILTYAIIGLIIVFLSAFIVSIVAYITNVNCLNTAGFNNCE